MESGAHALDEYYVIESSNSNFVGFDGAVKSYVDYFYELATIPLSNKTLATKFYQLQ